MRVLLDTDVLLDFFLERDLFVENATAILAASGATSMAIFLRARRSTCFIMHANSKGSQSHVRC